MLRNSLFHDFVVYLSELFRMYDEGIISKSSLKYSRMNILSKKEVICCCYEEAVCCKVTREPGFNWICFKCEIMNASIGNCFQVSFNYI